MNESTSPSLSSLPPPPSEHFPGGAPHIVIVTGMSGAGRSTALHVLEDMGYFCVDNLPMRLSSGLLSLIQHKLPEDIELRRLGFGVDVRTGAFLEGTSLAIETLRSAGYEVEVLFVDADDESLVRRYSETRRPHPMAPSGNLLEAIQKERGRLSFLREQSDVVIDTTKLSVHDLRRSLTQLLGRSEAGKSMVVRMVSFGFKYGLPVDADTVFDLRYLPNPHFVPTLQARTGLDPAVAAYVLDAGETKTFLHHVVPLLRELIPQYEREGKAYFTVALGCTGGKHRSVALVEHLGRSFQETRDVIINHRDVHR